MRSVTSRQRSRLTAVVFLRGIGSSHARRLGARAHAFGGLPHLTGLTSAAASAIRRRPRSLLRRAEPRCAPRTGACLHRRRPRRGHDGMGDARRRCTRPRIACIGSEDTFRSIWAWTTKHLLRPDGLLSWRRADGAVTDANSAADADLDSARALVLGGERFADAALTAAGVRLGQAILDGETVSTPVGRILTAGSWTAEGPPPWTVNPCYPSPVAAQFLHAASGDTRWVELAAGDRSALSTLLVAGTAPPDWAAVDASGQAVAVPAPGSAVVSSSYDAARVPPRHAESCDPRDQRLAASLIDALQSTDRFHAVAWVAVAAAQAAAGDDETAQESLHRAVQLDSEQPTCYGGVDRTRRHDADQHRTRRVPANIRSFGQWRRRRLTSAPSCPLRRPCMAA